MEESSLKNCREILKKNNLHPLKKLGKGGFSFVFLVEKIQLNQAQNQLYSVKCINKKQFTRRPSLYKYIQQEISMWRNLHHPNIVQLVRTFQDQGWIFMLMEYCDRGNIQMVQDQREGGLFSLTEVVKITREILEGLDYMHKKNLIHRDIKAENVLIVSPSTNKKSEIYVTKICDFGFCREDDQNVNTFCGTTSYMAPEIFQKKTYDCKVDVWALGVLIYYMLFGQYPFKGLNVQYEIVTKCTKSFNLKTAKLRTNPSILKQDMEVLTQLFADIFRISSQQRISVEELKKHKWFAKQKTSRNTTAESDRSEDQVSFDVQKCTFLKQIAMEVKSIKFLTVLQEVCFRFYLNKMMLHLLEPKIKEDKSIKKIYEEIQCENQEYGAILISNTKKVPINKFSEYFNAKAKGFCEFKQAYRMVVGHTFSKAHKSISQDISMRSRIKIKLFCCHVINRVFQKQHRNQIFLHYLSWLKRQKKGSKFDFKTFKRWIQVQNPQKLVQTVEIMNDKFYKRPI